MTDPRNLIIYALLALLLGMSALAGLQLNRVHDEQRAHAVTRQQHAEVLRDLAERTARAARDALAAQQAAARTVAAIDQSRTQEMTHALADNERRRAADTAGSGRLRIPAVCPAAPGRADVPGAAPAASVDPPAAEIPAAFRQELWDLRAALIEDQAKLLALQDYVRAIAGGADAVAR